MTRVSLAVPVLRGGMACGWTKDGRTLRVPEPANALWTGASPPCTYPEGQRPKGPCPRVPSGQVRVDPGKEVHHVCFVTYYAKRTWATSFQEPGEHDAIVRAGHLQRSTWLRGHRGLGVAMGLGPQRGIWAP